MTLPTVRMKLQADRLPEPLLGTLLRALEQFPAARTVVVDAIANAKTAPPKFADVHPDEVENWSKHGWERTL